jgi:hypothetical protein
VAPPALTGGAELTDAVALSATTVVAVGRSNGAPLILRWNGPPGSGNRSGISNPFLTGAAAAGPSSVWATGYRFELSAYGNRGEPGLGEQPLVVIAGSFAAAQQHQHDQVHADGCRAVASAVRQHRLDDEQPSGAGIAARQRRRMRLASSSFQSCRIRDSRYASPTG